MKFIIPENGYAIVIIPCGKSFTVLLPDFPGCIGEVTDLSDAVSTIEEIAEEWIKAALSQGQSIPPPLWAEKMLGKKK